MKNIALFTALALALAGCAGAPSSHDPAVRTETCKAADQEEIAALFDRWNESLQSGDPRQVAALYAERSILLPTVSNRPRLTTKEREDYFRYFLADKPSGKINARMIEIGCNSAFDAGVYTFTFAATGAQVVARYTYTYHWTGDRWLITSHHSSEAPEN